MLVIVNGFPSPSRNCHTFHPSEMFSSKSHKSGMDFDKNSVETSSFWISVLDLVLKECLILVPPEVKWQHASFLPPVQRCLDPVLVSEMKIPSSCKENQKHLINKIWNTNYNCNNCVAFWALSLAKKTDLSIIKSSGVNLCGRAWCFHELVMKEPFLFLSPPCGKLKDENQLSKYHSLCDKPEAQHISIESEVAVRF